VTASAGHARALAAALFCAATCGCGATSGDDAVTLRFWGLGREGEVVAQLLPRFERDHPGIRVEVQQIPWTAAHEKILTAFVGRSTPDVAQLGNTWVPELHSLDALVPLDGLQAASAVVKEDDYFPGIWDTNVLDGALFGVPWYVDTRVLFYRRDLLARAGYPDPPRTWDAWRAAMRAVQAKTGARFGVLLPTDEWAQVTIFALQKGSPILRDGGRYGDFHDPRFKDAFAFYVGMFRDGMAPAQNNAQIGNLYQQFAEGFFATYVTGPWNLGEFRRRLPQDEIPNWATAPLPAPDAASVYPGVSIAGGSSLVVFRASSHPEAAFALVEYLSRPETQSEFYRLTGDLPARMSAWNDPALASDDRAAAFRVQLARVVPCPKVPEWEQIATKIAAHAERAASGVTTVDRALDDLQFDVDRILEKRRWLLARRR
jgi:multiple sugar transport system substrate-binding protein